MSSEGDGPANHPLGSSQAPSAGPALGHKFTPQGVHLLMWQVGVPTQANMILITASCLRCCQGHTHTKALGNQGLGTARVTTWWYS